MNRRTFLPVLLAALVACNDSPTAIVTNGLVTVTREGSSLRISNGTSEARAFYASDPTWLALAAEGSDLSLLAFCNTTAPSCLRLPAHGSVLMSLTEVGGYSVTTKEINIYTWRVIEASPGAGEIVPDETIVLKL
jgi:hypothetical protein